MKNKLGLIKFGGLRQKKMEPDISVDNNVKKLVSQNKVPEAIKLVMDHYKLGLKQAKDYTDKLTGRIKLI